LEVDAVVVGAGLGGIYALHKLREQGLNVIGLEAGADIGGVWRHNRYPGARVDLESVYYCYHFSPGIYRNWRWSERYASQPELLRYLEHVVDRLGLREHFRFNTRMRGAQWRPETARYDIEAGEDLRISTRYLVMATGQLSDPKTIPFPGAERFQGELVRSSRWPDKPIDYAGKRVGLVGTGSSGVQIATDLAGRGGHLHVFQRSPNYSVPARNGPLDDASFDEVARDSLAARAHLYTLRTGTALVKVEPQPAATFSAEEQQARLEAQWESGGQGMGAVFTDQTTDNDVNDIVANFVRSKIRETVKDPVVAEKLCPDYPFGTRRLCIDTGYYEIYNRSDVTLVDVAEDPIAEITETGLRTRSRQEYELDVIILALGFRAFRGEIANANIRNEHGETPIDRWARGPRTLLGLMTAGFPNLFMLTAPGSPSVLSNMFLMNEYHVEWMARAIAFMSAGGYATIEPSRDAEERWTQHVQDAAGRLIRLHVDNYMVHVNEDDGSRVFMPYTGGLTAYIEAAERAAAADYEGFELARAPATAKAETMPA
jgi:cation diffusion facilitator CzcD-associated flavoprotein CzcO